MFSSLPPSTSNQIDREVEYLIREGVAAVKAGQRNQARMLLDRAAALNSGDARIWLWLSATTDDPKEQRTYLERAVAADPSNAAATRGLMMLTGKLKPVSPRQPAAGPQEAKAQVFQCPKCGGHMRYDIRTEALTCEFCGHVKEAEKRLYADAGEVAVSRVLPTDSAHLWAETQHRVSCEQCGAVTLLPPSQKADRCPYCGSNRMIESTSSMELIDPQGVILMKIDEQEAYAHFRKWLGKGILAPDDLTARAGRLRLVPAFYPFWTFDGSVEVSWVCEVNTGSNNHPHWETMHGAEVEFFDDVLVPGVKAMTMAELLKIEPFNLKDIVEFKPDFVAGWPALFYDLSMSDASLLAREKVIKGFRQTVYSSIEPGREKRNVRLGGGKWSGMTFKHILIPLWVGNYTYQDKSFRVLINGQTGKVGGDKPRDAIKTVMVALGIGLVVVIFSLILIWLLITYGSNWLIR